MCTVGLHTTRPQARHQWYPTWRCARCNKNLLKGSDRSAT